MCNALLGKFDLQLPQLRLRVEFILVDVFKDVGKRFRVELGEDSHVAV